MALAPKVLADVVGDAAVLAAIRSLVDGEFAAQRARCIPNTPETEQRRRHDLAVAEDQAAKAEADLGKAARAAAHRLAMNAIKPEGR